MKKILLLAALAVVVSVSPAVRGQNSQPPLDTVLAESQNQTQKYIEGFKNLLADEIKTFADYDKNGQNPKTTTVKSSFLVYQSGKNAKATAELRNVREVDGKPIPDSQKRGEEFLAELDKQQTLESELKKLEKEGSKYDRTLEISGLTLNQAVALAPNLRQYFDFRLAGTENVEGRDLIVLAFQQKAKTPDITVNEKERSTPGALAVNYDLDIPGELKKSNLFLRGRLWLDPQTFQVRREERELTAQAAGPVVLLSNVFEYQSSDYGILLPKTITLTTFKAKKNGDAFTTVKDLDIRLDYSNYRQTNVEVKILDDEN
ncbi:MAG: hypothetical protein JSS81_01485 [Acidobacteria bacterium]|nr:hypothetical protein [Acidobacteriota bacterium]